MTSTFQINRYSTDLLTSVQDRLGSTLDRMVTTAMTAFPSHWTDQERREMAEQQLFGKRGAPTEQRNHITVIVGSADRFLERERVCREVNDALVILTMEAL